MATLTIRIVLCASRPAGGAARPEPEQADGRAVGAGAGRTRQRNAVPDARGDTGRGLKLLDELDRRHAEAGAAK